MANLNFSDEDWARVERDTISWWNGELDRPLVYLAVMDSFRAMRDGQRAVHPVGYMSNFPADMPADQVVDCYAPWLESIRFYADAFPWIFVNFGPGIVAGFLGSVVNSVVEPGETVWFTPPREIAIQDLSLAYDPDNWWWQRVQAVTRSLVERYGSMLQVSHTDLGGNLDVLASFVTTERLLTDLIDQPNEVERLADQITSLWLKYYDGLDAIIRPTCRGTSAWAPLWSPAKTYMLQCDFSYMISPKMFERFVLPDLTRICDHLDHGFYHLDGKGEIPHLDMLLSIERLRGVQWIPGDGQPSPDQWLELLKRIRDGGKLCQVFVNPEGALRIVKNLGGKGFLLVVDTYGPEFNNPEVAQAFLQTLEQSDISRKNTFR